MKKETKKKDKCKSECKNLCVDCSNYSEESIDEEWLYICSAFKPKIKKNCIDGTKEEKHVLCENYNKNGNCKKFKPLSYFRLRKLLKEYLSDNPVDWACRETIERNLAQDLLNVLNKEDSKIFEELYTGDTPYDHAVVVSKEVIEESLRKRGYRLDAIKNPGSYGGLYGECKKEYDNECKEEEYWINKIKNLFGD